MRHIALSIAAWAGALQAVAPTPTTLDTAAHLIGVASVLGTLTVLVYRLGIWRQEMENTKNNAVSEVKSSFEQIDRRLDGVDHMLTDLLERHERLERWRSTTERRLERLESVAAAEHEQ